MAEPAQTPQAQPSRSTGEPPRRKGQEELAQVVGAKENRKVRARAEAQKGIWFGLGMFGMIGWSVIVPALLFIALGMWIDRTWPSRYSWTLMLLFVGIVLGCWNAWHWLSSERDKLER